MNPMNTKEATEPSVPEEPTEPEQPTPTEQNVPGNSEEPTEPQKEQNDVTMEQARDLIAKAERSFAEMEIAENNFQNQSTSFYERHAQFLAEVKVTMRAGAEVLRANLQKLRDERSQLVENFNFADVRARNRVLELDWQIVQAERTLSAFPDLIAEDADIGSTASAVE